MNPSWPRMLFVLKMTNMRMLLLLALFYVSQALPQQPARAPDWTGANINWKSFRPAMISGAQKSRIIRLISHHLKANSDECISAPDFPGPTFESVPLGRSEIVLVTSRAGCGGMSTRPAWVVEFSAGGPRILADVYGSGISVQSAYTLGLHDFILGWHMSCCETALSWFRFNGKTYEHVSSATAYTNDDVGSERMAAAQKRCSHQAIYCNLIRYKQPD